jgi:hypothetical protein
MINDEYRKIVLAQMREVLKPEGFRKKGNNFFKPEQDVYLFIQIQSSMSSSQNDLRLTVNPGIFSTLIEQSKPSLISSHWRERIGSLTERKLDKWWTITSSAEAETAGAEISELLREKALPLLYSLNSTAKLISYWEKGGSAGITEYERERFLKKLKR